MKKYLVVLAGSLALIASCKKDTTVSKSKTDYISQANWKLLKAEIKVGAATTWTDITASYSACEKDDQYIFRPVGTYEINEGATKCMATDPQIIETGNWGFANSETKIYLKATGSSSSDTSNIEILDDSNFIIQDFDNSGATPKTYRTTFGH